jgi:SWI/SNF-related matrix-associated actin-dependent regulator 1 of chromatin subfamily A
MGINGNGRMIAFPFQRRTVYEVERKFKGRSLIANDMGLGKTNCSLWIVKRKRLGEMLPALVICPRVVRPQWIKAIEDTLGIYPDVLETRKPSWHRKGGQVAIINYDIIAWWRDYLEAQNFQTLILDECQYLINGKRKRTRTATSLAKEIPYCLALSGTPLTNRPIELFPVINALRPREWPNRGSFAHRYCGPKFTRFGWDFTGASHIDELHVRLKQTCMVRFRKDEVLRELPEKVRTIIPVELSNPQEYRRARDDFIGWMKQRYPERLNKAVKAAALVRSGHLLRLAARLKLRSAIDWINYRFETNPNEKMVVFAVHRKCIAALKRRIKVKSIVVDGSVVGRHRDNAVAQFQNDRNTRCFIGNIAAAGIGLNLTQASTLCVVELAQKPGPLLQIEDRIHRIGQEKVSWIYYFIATDTIEESVSKLVQRKQKVITGTLDGGNVEDDFDLYDQLLEELENEIVRSKTK